MHSSLLFFDVFAFSFLFLAMKIHKIDTTTVRIYFCHRRRHCERRPGEFGITLMLLSVYTACAATEYINMTDQLRYP